MSALRTVIFRKTLRPSDSDAADRPPRAFPSYDISIVRGVFDDERGITDRNNIACKLAKANVATGLSVEEIGIHGIPAVGSQLRFPVIWADKSEASFEEEGGWFRVIPLYLLSDSFICLSLLYCNSSCIATNTIILRARLESQSFSTLKSHLLKSLTDFCCPTTKVDENRFSKTLLFNYSERLNRQGYRKRLQTEEATFNAGFRVASAYIRNYPFISFRVPSCAFLPGSQARPKASRDSRRSAVVLTT